MNQDTARQKEIETQIVRSFIKQIKEKRTELGYSQQDLAELSGTHRGHISDLEQGRRENLTLGMAARLCDALGMEVIFK